MVNCSKCGHEFLCDREKLIPKKPFAKAKKAVSVHSPKDRREAIQSALVETGLIQLVCLCASLAVAAGCVWIFTMLLPRWMGPFPFHAAAAPAEGVCPVFACLAGGLMACAGRRHKIVFILLGVLVAGGIASLPFVYPVKVNPSLLGGHEEGSAGEEDVSGFTSMGLEQLPSKNASVQNYGAGDLKPLFSAIDRKESQGVLGVWVVGVNAANRDMVKAYLKRMTQSEDEPIFMTARERAVDCSLLLPLPLRLRNL